MACSRVNITFILHTKLYLNILLLVADETRKDGRCFHSTWSLLRVVGRVCSRNGWNWILTNTAGRKMKLPSGCQDGEDITLHFRDSLPDWAGTGRFQSRAFVNMVLEFRIKSDELISWQDVWLRLCGFNGIAYLFNYLARSTWYAQLI
jgi:hypothetical protein